MKTEYRVNNLIYAAGPEMLNTIRMDVVLTEPVNRHAAEKAVNTAAKRFPYFAVRLARRGADLVMVRNDLPFAVSCNGQTVTLGTEESNFHLFAFACEGRHFYIDTVHYITDGNGMFPFVKTILYYYLRTVHPEEAFNVSEIALVDSPVPDDEADDYPYPDEPMPEDPLGEITRPDELFIVPDQPRGYENMGGWTSFCFSIRQKDMMAYVSSVDGSPSTFIASMMYKAIADVFPGNRLPVVCGMQHQFRSALGKPRSHMCHVNIVPVVYPDKVRNKSVELLNTMARGTLILSADDSNDVLTVNRHVKNERLISGMGLSEKHDYMRREILDGIGKNTFEVSYTGRVSWSGLDRYIENVYPYFDISLSGGISIEIFSVGDRFSIVIMQRNDDPAYSERFAQLFSEYGIPFDAADPEHFSLCGFRLPD